MKNLKTIIIYSYTVYSPYTWPYAFITDSGRLIQPLGKGTVLYVHIDLFKSLKELPYEQDIHISKN